MDQRQFFKEIGALTKSERYDDALAGLRDRLRRHELDDEGVERAGRLCRSLFAASGRRASRVLVLGQCTTTWVCNALTAAAWAAGTALDVVEGAYDNVLQQLLSAETSSERPDLVVLLPWNQRLLSGGSGRTVAERVEDECVFWRQAWALSTARFGTRIVQVGYDWITPGAFGYLIGGKGEGDVALVRATNLALSQATPAGAVFLDLEQVSGVMGREQFYDPRRFHWTKQPFSEAGAVCLAHHIAAAIRAVITGPKKVLVLDLDNTLWGGVVGDAGPLGVAVGDGVDGEAFRAFQAHVKKLTERGVLLAACSKNNDADAREPFLQNPNMVLSLDDFAHFEASWDPKAAGLRRIAKSLQLGLDSFVFFDDNPAEREHIRQALPEVEVVEVPDDPAEFGRTLDAGLWFETADLTGEDRVRAQQYRSAIQRRDAEASFDSLDAYLHSLAMVAEVQSIGEADLERVVQLIGKTNQFNLTTRRHSLAAVRELLGRPGAIGLALRLADRFGDHGLVSVLLAAPDLSLPESRRLTIDTWLMSCRVINRTAEEFLFNTLVEEALGQGVESLAGLYIPTAKNVLVKDLYPRLGFAERAASGGAGVWYDLNLRTSAPARTFVQSRRTPQGIVA